MDLDAIAEKVSNLGLYDIKAGFRKAQNGKHGSHTSEDDKLLYVPRYSPHELYRTGVESPRSHQQRTLGMSYHFDARNRQCHL